MGEVKGGRPTLSMPPLYMRRQLSPVRTMQRVQNKW
jgi:hypothetical protein